MKIRKIPVILVVCMLMFIYGCPGTKDCLVFIMIFFHDDHSLLFVLTCYSSTCLCVSVSLCHSLCLSLPDNAVGPSECCFDYYPSHLPKDNVVTFQRTSVHCAKDGVVWVSLRIVLYLYTNTEHILQVQSQDEQDVKLPSQLPVNVDERGHWNIMHIILSNKFLFKSLVITHSQAIVIVS